MNKNEIISVNGSSIVMYTSEDGITNLDVKLEDETVWLTRQQMADLFGRDVKTIGKHINNALHEELEGEAVAAKFATSTRHGAIEGKMQTSYPEYYSLEMITSVGFRVKSKRGVQFRKWANKVLRQYLMKGYAVDRRRLDHYNELKNVVHLMARALELQSQVSNTEYSGLFNVIGDYVYALDTLDRYDYQELAFQRWQQTHCCHALSVVFGSESYSLCRGWS